MKQPCFDTTVDTMISHLQRANDVTTALGLFAAILSDKRSYLKPKIHPSDGIRQFIHEATLSSTGLAQLFGARDAILVRLQDAGKFYPAAFGIPGTTSDDRRQYRFHACLSYASEDRQIVKRIARRITRGGALRVFFDEFARHDLVGENLIEYLYQVYAEDSLLCVAFFS